ncbi:MAG: sigma-70 family RNA polymerase sigma factor [Syntrophomonadaceae bacterium]|jgi:RNA polymerase sigma-70 factor (ECF subfamily)|nr:sigma-70 family RNA polymerase sigma factor [Syntrophomonadaceae bacterium]
MDIPDEILAVQMLHGDTHAFEELLNRYQKMVFKTAYRMMGQKEEAEDIAQEVFITIYSKAHQFNPEKKFSSWLYRITLNACISRLRTKRPTISSFFDESAFGSTDSKQSHVNPLTVLQRKELTQHIWNAVGELPENYRVILILRYQMDFCNQEIADILGIKKDNVEVRIHRARKALRKHLLNSDIRLYTG